ncbi:MAG: hypothetical protein ACREQN_11830 [Candidatus Binataceae bacterium]
MSFFSNGFAWFHAADAAIAESANELGRMVSRPVLSLRPLLMRTREPASSAGVREDILKLVTVEKFRGARFEARPTLRGRTR